MTLALGLGFPIARFRAAIAPPAAFAPVNVVAPALSGTPNVGQVLTCSQGSWDAEPTPTFAYQWLRGATTIGTNSSTYTLVAADAGQVITCRVTATNSAGSASATSNGLTGRSLPVNTVIPVVTGTTAPGDTLTVSNGTWTGFPAPTFTYHWAKDGVIIPGETANTYVIAVVDEAHVIQGVVTATNAVGSDFAESLPVNIPVP
jgi:hypothetical protein